MSGPRHARHAAAGGAASVVPDAPAADLIDLADAGRVLRRGWRAVLLAGLAGTVGAAGVLLFAPRRFEGGASVVLRSAQDAGTSLLGRLGLPPELAPAAVGSAMRSPVETELQILASRAVLGVVVDSLRLQARVLAPRGVPPWTLVHDLDLPRAFRRRTLEFERDGAGWRVRGPGAPDAPVPAGAPVRLDVGTLTLAPGALPARFRLQLFDREEALRRLGDRLDVAKAGGEVVRVGYAAPDSSSAAAVPNLIVGAYLDRRRTVDRSVNAYRAEFLGAQADSIGAQLAAAERALRAAQEAPGGVLDPEVVGRLELEGAGKVREQLAALEVEGRALEQLLAGVGSGRLPARQLAGFPTLLRSPAINEIVAQLAALETERTRLLERRTDRDPDVVALSASITQLERQVEPLGRAYASSLARQQAELRAQATRFERELAGLPAAAQQHVRLQREVRRLGQTALAIQSQLLDARLAAVAEGGDARLLDVAIAPRRPAFPRPLPTLAVGIGGGLALGVVSVLLVGLLSPRIGGAADAARVAQLPAATLGHGSPVFHAAVALAPVAVAPLDATVDAAAVARWLATPSAPAATGAAGAAGATARSVALEGALAARGAGTARHDDDEGVGATRAVEPSYAPPVTAARRPPVLPPLADPAGAAALRGVEHVVLVVPTGVTRGALSEALVAIALAGATPVAVVVA